MPQRNSINKKDGDCNIHHLHVHLNWTDAQSKAGKTEDKEKMKNMITATMVFFIVVSAGCIGTEEKSNMTGMPNPAAVYCKNMGYEYQIVTDSIGSQRGECKVDDRWVDEWTLYRNASETDVIAIGGDQDEHGCYLAAGYSWCNEKEKCVRPWEENCSDYTIAKTTNESCTKDSDCTTPGEYLMMSHCPYTSKCVNEKCAVVCPFPFIASKPEVSNYEECVAAGYGIMKSNPPQCMTPGGRTFTETIGGGVGMPNPAAVYCKKLGYEYRIVTDADGSQRGECKTAEGVWVDEWALYNKEITVTQPLADSQKKECEGAGGHWNECGSRCMLDNQGKEGVACTMQCETLCECGGIAGFSCPKGYSCKMPTGIADALGYCVPKQTAGEERSCEDAGGRWNDCGSKCGIDNQGKDVACPAICDSICECGTAANLKCPAGYACNMPQNVANATGYCAQIQGGGGAKLSLTEARKIAEGSDCAKKGTLTKKITYNNVTGTWWFDLEMREEYRTKDCNPACVVAEETKTAEINWMCTGLIPSPIKEPFCGTSTNGSCTEDADCITGGCSGQVCQGRTEEPVITTCEYRDCYRATDYGLGCKCVDNKCQWSS
jgi:eight-cysteine-cluster-containing protein